MFDCKTSSYVCQAAPTLSTSPGDAVMEEVAAPSLHTLSRSGEGTGTRAGGGTTEQEHGGRSRAKTQVRRPAGGGAPDRTLVGLGSPTAAASQGSLQNYRRVAEQHRRVEEALRLRASRAGGSTRGAAGSETLPTCFSPAPPQTARAEPGTGADTDVRQCSASNAVEHLRELTELLVRGVRTEQTAYLSTCLFVTRS
eukprot:CAMPEP_0181356894 /NCGR_PEP_ID=MMETSP1106-20121128/4665_1 /TAXON_ID=81844 /ORGANISM="Mantoniella antarctica, Strain SL-175" /LENGTH=196 /DNA_ID=CAMNT_0023469709 /DNA_START=910 /DNA_END=1502 /DNA_ORIENTATION=+